MNISKYQRSFGAVLSLAFLLGSVALAPCTAYAQGRICGPDTTPCPPEPTSEARSQTPSDGRLNTVNVADPYVFYCVTGQLQIYKVNANAQGEFYGQTPLTTIRRMSPAGAKVALARGFTIERSNDDLTVSGPNQFRVKFSLNTCLVRGGITGGNAQPDFNNDGIADVVTTGKQGEVPFVRVTSGKTGENLVYFFAYEPSFTGGISVAVGDLNGDGIADIVTVPGAGLAANVRAFDGKTSKLLLSFFAFDPLFKGGATTSISNVNNDAQNDIVVVAQINSRTYTSAFDGKSAALLQATIK